MSFNISGFKGLVDNFYEMIRETRESICSIKLSEDKWTLKEMLGHLIDSASNNHQRFVRLQLTEKLEFPKYEAETWNRVQKVNSLDCKLLVGLWKNYNELILHIIAVMDENALSHFWVKDSENLSLEFLVKDYYRHLKWHMDLFQERKKEIEGREH